MSNFAAIVQDWTRQTEASQLAVLKRAIELLADRLRQGVQNDGKVPWDKGDMARSLLAVPNGDVTTADGTFETASDVGAVVALMTLDDTITLGYQAKYAMRQNYGFVGEDKLGRTYNQTGAGFVEDAVAMWPELVKKAEDEIMSLVNS